MNDMVERIAAGEATVHEQLRTVMDPCSIAAGVPVNVLDMGIVRSVQVRPERVQVLLRLTNPFCFQATLICEAIESQVEIAMRRPVDVAIDPTDDWCPEMMAAPARSRLRRLRPLPAPTVGNDEPVEDGEDGVG